jgi:hypothetical protein
MQWYDLRQYALMSPRDEQSSEASFLRAYMRLLAASRRPDRPTQVFNGFRPERDMKNA